MEIKRHRVNFTVSHNVLFLQLSGKKQVLVVFYSLCLTHILIYLCPHCLRNEGRYTGRMG